MPILFDLDDTLLDDRAGQHVYLAQIFDSHRADLPYESLAAFHAVWRDAVERSFSRYLAGELTIVEQRQVRVREVFGQPSMPQVRVDAFIAEYLAAYEASWRLFPDVLATLDALEGTPLGIITNGHQQQQLKKLRSLGILERFEVVVVSEAVGHSKPQRQIFEYACAKLGCAPRDCAFIGDDWARDIGGASAANMTPIWRNHADRAEQRDGVLAINALAELIERADARDAIAHARRC
jgi:putative hydrolase of the HAD superfamily